VTIPWWVYLITVVMVVFGAALHMLPSYLAKLDARDRQRREEARAARETEDEGGS
jgi:hypothetical protein